MKNNKLILLETFVTLIHDNIVNIIIICLAKHVFDITFKTSFSLWLIAQSLNLIFSFIRRFYFDKYQFEIKKWIVCLKD
jgi:hypothetical protein